MTSPNYTNAWGGNWKAVHIPAQEFAPNTTGTIDPGAPGTWENGFAGAPRMNSRGLVWDHPTGVNPDLATADYDLVLPPQVKHERSGAILDYAISFAYWTSGGLAPGSEVLFRTNLSHYDHGDVLGSTGHVTIDHVLNSPGAMQLGRIQAQGLPPTGPWVGAQAIPEESLLHLQVARIYTNGVFFDTYVAEFFLIAVTLHYRVF